MELESLLEKALAMAEDGDWAASADLLRDHLEEHEAAPEVHCWLGVAERELGLEGIAYERFKRALSLDPTDPYVLATSGNALAAFDDPEAEGALRTAALTAPDLPMARMLYGAYLAREGYVEEGAKELKAARALDADDPQIVYELGVAHVLAGAFDAAVDALGDAVALDPDDAWVRVVFGLALFEDGQPVEAAGELLEGARRAPEDVEAQVAAALAAAGIGRDDDAYEMLERARVRGSDEDQALLLGAEERVEAGSEEAARFLAADIAPEMLRRRVMERP